QPLVVPDARLEDNLLAVYPSGLAEDVAAAEAPCGLVVVRVGAPRKDVEDFDDGGGVEGVGQGGNGGRCVRGEEEVSYEREVYGEVVEQDTGRIYQIPFISACSQDSRARVCTGHALTYIQPDQLPF